MADILGQLGQMANGRVLSLKPIPFFSGVAMEGHGVAGHDMEPNMEPGMAMDWRCRRPAVDCTGHVHVLWVGENKTNGLAGFPWTATEQGGSHHIHVVKNDGPSPFRKGPLLTFASLGRCSRAWQNAEERETVELSSTDSSSTAVILCCQ